jgi:hypothetical protein
MNEKSQNHAKTGQVARMEKLKHSVSTVVAHKNPVVSTGHCGRKFQKAFCVSGTLLPVCLRVGFQFMK